MSRGGHGEVPRASTKRERYLSIRNQPLEARRQYQSRSASSIIRGPVTIATTSTNTDGASAGTLRNEAIALTVADTTIAMRTGWL
jgi:hypothetical protein